MGCCGHSKRACLLQALKRQETDYWFPLVHNPDAVMIFFKILHDATQECSYATGSCRKKIPLLQVFSRALSGYRPARLTTSYSSTSMKAIRNLAHRLYARLTAPTGIQVLYGPKHAKLGTVWSLARKGFGGVIELWKHPSPSFLSSQENSRSKQHTAFCMQSSKTAKQPWELDLCTVSCVCTYMLGI